MIISIYVEIKITRGVREEGESDEVGDVGKKMNHSNCWGKDRDQCSVNIMGTVDSCGDENVKQLLKGGHLYDKTCGDLCWGVIVFLRNTIFLGCGGNWGHQKDFKQTPFYPFHSLLSPNPCICALTLVYWQDLRCFVIFYFSLLFSSRLIYADNDVLHII